MIENLKEMLEEIRTKRIKYYTLLSFKLDSARSQEPVIIAGSYIYVLGLDGTAKIKLNENAHDDIDLFKYRQITSPFYRFFLTHSAQANKTLDLAIGVGSEVFSIQDFQTPDLSQMASDIATLKAEFLQNFDVDQGDQVAKSNIATNTTVIIHTVTAGKTLILEAYASSFVTSVGALAYMGVRNESDVIQYYLAYFPTGGAGANSINALPRVKIPAGYDIVLTTNSASCSIHGFIKGREV